MNHSMLFFIRRVAKGMGGGIFSLFEAERTRQVANSLASTASRGRRANNQRPLEFGERGAETDPHHGQSEQPAPRTF